MSKSTLKPVDELNYEEAYAELEQIIGVLESEQRSLDESMTLFERGQSLLRHCAGLLDKAELKVQRLSEETLTDFEAE